MPEGDTVWNTAERLRQALAGQRLTGSDLRVPQLATTDLSGWLVHDCASRGKHLLLRLAAPDDRRYTLHSHLRMDGSWRVYRSGARWTGGPAQLIRVVLRTATVVAVGYHLHELTIVPTRQEARLTGTLGPDLLGADWDPAEAVRRLAAHPEITVAEALLDQRNLAGIGNVYACEVLFLRGVAPWTPVGAVPDLPALVDLAHRLLRANRGRPRRSITGLPAAGTYVYGRAHQPCRRCGTAVRRAELAGRVSYWCPNCQPDRRGAAAPPNRRRPPGADHSPR
ncbi:MULTISPECIES: DNA-formamidopyrimidine glycosylase family protein [unclassified Solwaraspora]|uniref:DNA-formamidopyrimidine glycosylase family protein n=1 Tax=unclassified Solwaraspora TaxID=2627926 RepID=UPI00259B7A1A|nr:DNA-formamidopyrimidine glycosylase family protein [Solwaraspora sp. WMMA2056]WJK39893.1 zinc finger domain-containing protein [Solwaraspora sp. WMMA2056]